MKKLSPSLIQIVNLLNEGEYQTGNTLGQTLELTRAAIWKAIQKLENYGIKIDSVKGKGYALQEPLSLLDSEKIREKLQDKNLDIDIFENIPSTSQYLKSLDNSLLNQKIKICLAEQQTQGRGRLNRVWHSPFGKNIYFSCCFPFKKDVSELSGLSLVVGLAVIKTLEMINTQADFRLKWPNDVFYENKKLAGILIEIQAETNGLCQVVISVGMNVNLLEDNAAITQAWTSLRKITQQYIDRNALVAHLINTLLSYLKRFDAQSFAQFAQEWTKVDYLLHQEITLKNAQHTISGKVLGVNSRGQLLLQLADGDIREFSSGDATILRNVQHREPVLVSADN